MNIGGLRGEGEGGTRDISLQTSFDAPDRYGKMAEVQAVLALSLPVPSLIVHCAV
jgi:hypothetical protein